MAGKQECSCNCNKGVSDERSMANGLAHNEMPVEGLHYNGPINDPSSVRLGGLVYGADYHPIKKAKISDIIIKEIDYGYIVKIGCQTLAIESQIKLTKWLTEYIANPDAVTKKWNAGYYHFRKVQECNIGVIARDKKDFEEWCKQFPDGMLGIDTEKNIRINVVNDFQEHTRIVYYCISTINRCKGLELDRIVETNCARENRDFEVIVENSQECLSK